MTYELRLTALNLAGQLPHQSADELIAAATKIENHLRGTTSLSGNSTGDVLPPLPPASEEDKRAYKEMFEFKPEVLEWTTHAEMVKQMMLTGSTLLNVAREIGTTTFLADFVAEQSRAHKQILWLSSTGRDAEAARELILKRGGLVAVVDFGGLNRFTEPTSITSTVRKATTYDFIVVDGLASLPYGKEIDFVTTVVPQAKNCIFASTPGQERGLFFDLWERDNTEMQKVALMWNTPLRPHTEDAAQVLKTMTKLRGTIGEDRFRNQFECAFRSIGDNTSAE